MITIFGTTYFTIGAGLIVLALAAPLLLWLSFWLLRPNIEGKPRRVRWLAVGGTTLGLLLLAAVGLFWDVYLIGQRAKELCAGSGMSIRETARANSLIGVSATELWIPYGFTFLEYEVGKQRFRASIRDGKPFREKVPEFLSEYQFSSSIKSVSETSNLTNRSIMRRHDSVIALKDGRVLGTLEAYIIGPGWLDRYVIAASGFSFSPWICGKNPDGNLTYGEDRIGHSDLIRSALQPVDIPRRGIDEHESTK